MIIFFEPVAGVPGCVHLEDAVSARALTLKNNNMEPSSQGRLLSVRFSPHPLQGRTRARSSSNGGCRKGRCSGAVFRLALWPRLQVLPRRTFLPRCTARLSVDPRRLRPLRTLGRALLPRHIRVSTKYPRLVRYLALLLVGASHLARRSVGTVRSGRYSKYLARLPSFSRLLPPPKSRFVKDFETESLG